MSIQTCSSLCTSLGVRLPRGTLACCSVNFNQFTADVSDCHQPVVFGCVDGCLYGALEFVYLESIPILHERRHSSVTR